MVLEMLSPLGISHSDCFSKVFMAVVLRDDLRKGKPVFDADHAISAYPFSWIVPKG